MAKPPPSTPHSDIDGIHKDERPNTDVAAELGQDAGDVADAKADSKARPVDSDMRKQDQESKDDRTR